VVGHLLAPGNRERNREWGQGRDFSGQTNNDLLPPNWPHLPIVPSSYYEYIKELINLLDQSYQEPVTPQWLNESTGWGPSLQYIDFSGDTSYPNLTWSHLSNTFCFWLEVYYLIKIPKSICLICLMFPFDLLYMIVDRNKLLLLTWRNYIFKETR
jgi:hypothetical protein